MNRIYLSIPLFLTVVLGMGFQDPQKTPDSNPSSAQSTERHADTGPLPATTQSPEPQPIRIPPDRLARMVRLDAAVGLAEKELDRARADYLNFVLGERLALHVDNSWAFHPDAAIFTPADWVLDQQTGQYRPPAKPEKR